MARSMKTLLTQQAYANGLNKPIKLRTLSVRLIRMKILSLLLVSVCSDMIGFNRLGNTVGKHIGSTIFNQKDELSVKLQMIQFMLKRGEYRRSKNLFKQPQKPLSQKYGNRLNLYLQKSAPRSRRHNQ